MTVANKIHQAIYNLVRDENRYPKSIRIGSRLLHQLKSELASKHLIRALYPSVTSNELSFEGFPLTEVPDSRFTGKTEQFELVV